MESMPSTFPHHRLDAYRVSIQAMTQAVDLSRRIPTGHRHIADQIKRSATSVVANIAEGANRRTAAEKRQRFADARAEAGETEAWLEILVALGILPEADVVPTAILLDRVAAMLTKLIARSPRCRP